MHGYAIYCMFGDMDWLYIIIRLYRSTKILRKIKKNYIKIIINFVYKRFPP